MDTRIVVKKVSFSDLFIRFLLLLVSVGTVYPFIYVFSMSVSSLDEVMKQSIVLLPKGFSLESYRMVFKNPEFWQSYYNTFWYTLFGTAFTVLMTILAAYPLSKKRMPFRKSIMLFFTLTMLFNGGIIPGYILVSSLGLYNTRWAIIIPFTVGAYYIILARTFFQTLPESLEESAKIDGANEIRVLVSIYLPLSMPIIAVLVLFNAVAFWNSFFTALIFLADSKLMPIQIYLRRILIDASAELLRNIQGSNLERAGYMTQLKYSSIMITILPIIIVYPFLQKYFVAGIMIGSIKE